MREFAGLEAEARPARRRPSNSSVYRVLRLDGAGDRRRCGRYGLVDVARMDGPGDRQHPVGPWAMPRLMGMSRAEWTSPRPSAGSGTRGRPPRASGGWMRSSRSDDGDPEPQARAELRARNACACCLSIPRLPRPPLERAAAANPRRPVASARWRSRCPWPRSRRTWPAIGRPRRRLLDGGSSGGSGDRMTSGLRS